MKRIPTIHHIFHNSHGSTFFKAAMLRIINSTTDKPAGHGIKIKHYLSVFNRHTRSQFH